MTIPDPRASVDGASHWHDLYQALHRRWQFTVCYDRVWGKPLMLTMDQVTRVARDAARDTSPDLLVTGVLLGGSADGAYVEILINITGCRGGVCQVSVGVFRDVTATDLAEHIAAKLREHLTAHPSRA